MPLALVLKLSLPHRVEIFESKFVDFYIGDVHLKPNTNKPVMLFIDDIASCQTSGEFMVY